MLMSVGAVTVSHGYNETRPYHFLSLPSYFLSECIFSCIKRDDTAKSKKRLRRNDGNTGGSSLFDCFYDIMFLIVGTASRWVMFDEAGMSE
jgi:hypothetical protein